MIEASPRSPLRSSKEHRFLRLTYTEKRDGFSEHWAVVDGIPIHYIASGQPNKKAVFYLHGALDKADLSGKEIVPTLGNDGHFVVAPDLPGYGQSGKPLGYTTEDYVNAVIGLADALDVQEADFIGTSKGGGIALAAVKKQPERFRSSVLIGSWGLGKEIPLPGVDRFPLVARAISPARRIGAEILSDIVTHVPALTQAFLGLEQAIIDNDGLKSFFVNRVLSRIVAYSANVTEELRQEVINSVRDTDASETFIRWFFGDGYKNNHVGDLREIEQPTLLIHGRNDRLVPIRWSREAARIMPHAQLHELESCGHLAARERPDEVNSLASAFIALRPAA